MSITRRKVLAGSAVGAASLASGLAAPAIAANEPIKIGYLPALTGPSSSTGIGINRGTVLAVDEINAAGGIDGRKIELIVRDTQSDPTKAVNAVAELAQRQKVAIIFGPLNSGDLGDLLKEFRGMGYILRRFLIAHAEPEFRLGR